MMLHFRVATLLQVQYSGGGLTLSLRDHEVTEFYHFLKKNFYSPEDNRKCGSAVFGLQEDGKTWIIHPRYILTEFFGFYFCFFNINQSGKEVPSNHIFKNR